MSYKKINQKAWDALVVKGDTWTQPVSSDIIQNARDGEWSIVLTPKKTVPRSWFPKDLKGLNILCLASGGGQQGPVLAATGAKVTVFDYSSKQLEQDELVAKRDCLVIKTVQGDMCDLSCFNDEIFDLIIHPWSNCFVEDIIPVWKEAFRVLRHGGSLLSGFGNPLEYIFDMSALDNGKFVIRHTIPYSDLTSLPKEELQKMILDTGEPICFGHTLEDQIQGQINAGFLIAGFYEDVSGSALSTYLNTGIATKAIKL